MYYLKIRDDDGGNSLNYYCRNCGHEDTTLTAETICVSETQLRRSEQKYTHMVNEYTKFDPTLPRINTIKCPNQECSSNGGHKGPSGGNNGIDVQAMGVFSSEGGAGKKKTEAQATVAAAVAQATVAAEGEKTTKKIIGSKNKTAKTLAKEEAEEEKEEKETAKKEATAAKKFFAEEEKEEQENKIKTTHSISKKTENEREVIYIRYDDINMKYVYLCVHCDTTWKTDNRM